MHLYELLCFYEKKPTLTKNNTTVPVMVIFLHKHVICVQKIYYATGNYDSPNLSFQSRLGLTYFYFEICLQSKDLLQYALFAHPTYHPMIILYYLTKAEII